MSLKNIPARVYLRYGLLMIPGTTVLVLILIIVQHWVAVPAWLLGLLVFLWIAKEVIMFPFLWRAYDWKQTDDSGSMIGKRGLTTARLAPNGYIKIQGELWRAEIMGCDSPIEKGEWVQVKKVEGLKLFVSLVTHEDSST